MMFKELPQEVQDRLTAERIAQKDHDVNTPYRIELHNEDGTRYIVAHRFQYSWGDDKGHYMPFGGGSQWEIHYGKWGFKSYRDPFGDVDYMICNGKCFCKSQNGTEIPKYLDTKKEVIALIKAIGIFNIK